MSEKLRGREPKKLNIPCPNCKGLKTYENTKNFGWTIITNSLYCGDCGRAFYFGNSTEKQITIK